MRVPHNREMLDMKCRSCDSETVRMVIDLGEQPLCNRLVKADTPVGSEPVYPLRLGYCETCTMLQIDHTIPRDDMFRDYVYVSGTTDTLKRHFQDVTDRLRDTYQVEATDLVVDIGSNDGTWLKTWGKWQRVLGVEPAPEIASMAHAANIRTLNEYFDLGTARFIRARDGGAKLITSNGSFFHMEDLHGACEGVKALLADDGVFVCGAIGGDDMIRGTAFDQVLHEHLCYYTPNSFAWLMDKHGLELFEWTHHPIHGGTWEYHVRRKTNMKETRFLPTVDWKECDHFAHRVMALRESLVEMLKAYQRRGKVVWAYGAPGKGGTLLNSFRIGRDLVECATEKNPLKFGLSIPGCRIPIIPENSGRPDAYLVLAWNFLDEFVSKEAAWLDEGGEFIVPVPTLRFVTGEARA